MDESRFGLHTMVKHCRGLRGKRVVRPFRQKFGWGLVFYWSPHRVCLDGEPVFCRLPAVSCEAA